MARQQRLHCHICGKQVSTGFEPVPTDTPDKGIIIRALIICPECIEKEIVFVKDSDKKKYH
jgi:ribosomal protein S27E